MGHIGAGHFLHDLARIWSPNTDRGIRGCEICDGRGAVLRQQITEPLEICHAVGATGDNAELVSPRRMIVRSDWYPPFGLSTGV